MPSGIRPYKTLEDPVSKRILVNSAELARQMRERLGYSYSDQHLRRLTFRGVLPAVKFKGIWFFDADRICEQLRNVERPPKSSVAGIESWL